MDFDIASDFAGEVGFGSKDAAGDQIALNFGEPDFDLIEPGRVSRGVTELSVGMGSEELSHGLGLVRRKVISDDVDLLALGLRGDDICEKGHELRAGVALGGFAQDLSAGNLQGGVKRQSAMPETQSRTARHARAKGVKPDQADRELEWRSSRPRRTRQRGPEA